MTTESLISIVDDLTKRQQECINFFRDIRSIGSPKWESMSDKTFKVHDDFTTFWDNLEDAQIAIDANVSHKIAEALNVDHKIKKLVETIQKHKNQRQQDL